MITIIIKFLVIVINYNKTFGGLHCLENINIELAIDYGKRHDLTPFPLQSYVHFILKLSRT